MLPRFDQLDLKDPELVERVLRAGAAANREASCREKSIDVARAPGRLIATGDLHDNSLHLARLVHAAGLEPGVAVDRRAHLTLHELIHSDRLVNGMDFSYRVLTRAAALKAEFPELVHTLLANHELAQLTNAGVAKDGVRCVDAFNEAVRFVFGERAEAILSAVNDFIRSMPIALRCSSPADILCSHSLPAPENINRFDDSILERDLTDDDYASLRGSAYFMVWGRGHTPDLLQKLGERWGVGLFILGHEHADSGIATLPPNAIILNSDHARGVYLPVDLAAPPRPDEALRQSRPLAD